MRLLTAVACSGWLACSSAIFSSTPNGDDFVELTDLLHKDWSRITTSVVEEQWPRKLAKRVASDGGCAGTVVLSDALATDAEACRRCDTFLFDRVRSEITGCSESLSAVTLVRDVANESAAEDLGKRLQQVIRDSSPDARVTPYEHGYTIVSWLGPTTNQTVRYDIERSGGHIRTRLLIFRTDTSHK